METQINKESVQKDRAFVDEIQSIIQRGQENILKLRREGGLWKFPAYLGPFFICQYFLACEWMNIEDSGIDREYLKDLLLARQLSDGGWYQLKDINFVEGELNVSIITYWTLKVLGVSPQSEPMKRDALERRALKSRAHGLDPVVLIGDKGLSGAVLAEIELALAAHELIKIRVGADRDARARLLEEICVRTSASAVQHIGKVLVLFRPKPPSAPTPKPAARKRERRKPPAGRHVGERPAATGPDKFAPRRGGRPAKAAAFDRPARGRAAGKPTDTVRRESRSASPRRAPARPPGRRRTSR